MQSYSYGTKPSKNTILHYGMQKLLLIKKTLNVNRNVNTLFWATPWILHNFVTHLTIYIGHGIQTIYKE